MAEREWRLSVGTKLCGTCAKRMCESAKIRQRTTVGTSPAKQMNREMDRESEADSEAWWKDMALIAIRD